MTKIAPTSWHYKVYVFNSQLCAKWHNDDSEFHEYPLHTRNIGLCPYMRMIFIWGPLVVLTYILVAMFIALTVWTLPSFATNGVSGTLWLLGSIAAMISGVLLMGSCIDYCEKRKDIIRQKNNDIKNSMTADEYDAFINPVKEATFWSLCKDYLKSMKTKVCPVLEFRND
jgi:hypothetical protein